MDWERIQQERLESIHDWHRRNYVRPREIPIPPVVRYMTLWAVFNALYNVAFLPKRRVRSVSSNGIPYIRYKGDKSKIKEFSRHISEQSDLVKALVEQHYETLRGFSNRRPRIDQPHPEITVQVDGEERVFKIEDFRGIASIDNRYYLEDGSILYQYTFLDFDLNDNGEPNDSEKFMQQLLLFLYQLRNNIVHGGAAFVETKKLVANQAIPVLETVVNHVLDHEEVIMTAAR
jgi:hypothetical protein